MNELEQARQEIDRIDRQMAALFEQRMKAVGRVALYKKQNDLPILDEGREARVVEKNKALIQDPALRNDYEDYIRFQMALSRRYQARLLEKEPE